ncbi:MAG TPA: type I-MYXAN CRISPR-associated protein Cas5/Cmx5/DevS [Planctomycetaceae bacterium]
MLRLDLRAPFAASRPMMAGWHRPTAALLAPSTIYGLLLNVAGVESRLREEEAGHPGTVPASMTRSGLPRVRLAMGIPEGNPLPRVQMLFQQLHNYPVGKDAGVPAEWTRGNKNNISPVRRELLSDVRLVLAVEAEADVENRIRRGLAGELNSGRYGLPFVGDNSFLLDRLDPLEHSPACRWIERVKTDEPDPDQVPVTARLTVWIDRADMTRTVSYLYAPSKHASATSPEEAWTWIPPEPASS